MSNIRMQSGFVALTGAAIGVLAGGASGAVTPISSIERGVSASVLVGEGTPDVSAISETVLGEIAAEVMVGDSNRLDLPVAFASQESDFGSDASLWFASGLASIIVPGIESASELLAESGFETAFTVTELITLSVDLVFGAVRSGDVDVAGEFRIERQDSPFTIKQSIGQSTSREISYDVQLAPGDYVISLGVSASAETEDGEFDAAEALASYNFRAQFVPAPGAAGLLGLAGLGAMRRRR